MQRWMVAWVVLAATGACVQETQSVRVIPTTAEQACMVEVSRATGRRDLVVESSAATTTGELVTIVVGPEQTRLTCDVQADGSADGVKATLVQTAL